MESTAGAYMCCILNGWADNVRTFSLKFLYVYFVCQFGFDSKLMSPSVKIKFSKKHSCQGVSSGNVGSTGHMQVSCWLYLLCQHYTHAVRATVHLTGKAFCPLPWWAFISDRCHWLFHPAHPCDCPGQCWLLHRKLGLSTSLQKLKKYSTNSQSI